MSGSGNGLAPNMWQAITWPKKSYGAMYIHKTTMS